MVYGMRIPGTGRFEAHGIPAAASKHTQEVWPNSIPSLEKKCFSLCSLCLCGSEKEASGVIDKYFKQNVFGISSVEFLWGLGLPVVIESTFLQLFLKSLGASSLAIGFIPAFFMFKIYAPEGIRRSYFSQFKDSFSY